MKTKLFILFISSTITLIAQEKTNKKESEYRFTTIKNIEATPVQNQNMTSTCWSFSALSFFESEIIRLGKGKDYNLSEMFIVRKSYAQKADNYIRMQGKTNFGEGGEFSDALNVIKNYGLMPEEIYTGKKDINSPHYHKILETNLKKIIQTASLDETDKVDFDLLHDSVNTVCDEFLGKTPDNFEYKGKSYTAKSYAESTGLNPDDYIFITSFSHHPFYSKFVLEVPDNWNWESMYNLPINELQEVISYAINKGYTIAWAADVSEKGFLYTDGLAINPEKPISNMSDEEKKKLSIKPHKQLANNQDIRQKAFDNFETQDDHGMHIVGLVQDQLNTPYYLVKNSWGKERNQCDGYFYASESYVLFKTTNIMINKNALAPIIAKKLGIIQ